MGMACRWRNKAPDCLRQAVQKHLHDCFVLAMSNHYFILTPFSVLGVSHVLACWSGREVVVAQLVLEDGEVKGEENREG